MTTALKSAATVLTVVACATLGFVTTPDHTHPPEPIQTSSIGGSYRAFALTDIDEYGTLQRKDYFFIALYAGMVNEGRAIDVARNDLAISTTYWERAYDLGRGYRLIPVRKDALAGTSPKFAVWLRKDGGVITDDLRKAWYVGTISELPSATCVSLGLTCGELGKRRAVRQ